MDSSLLGIADNLAEGLHKGKCENCESGLDYAAVEDNTLTFRCQHCNKSYEKGLGKVLTKRFQNTDHLCDGDINKFCLMLLKGVCSYEYMHSWKIVCETLLPERKYFTAVWQWKTIQMITADMKKSLRIFHTHKVTHCSWQTHS